MADDLQEKKETFWSNIGLCSKRKEKRRVSFPPKEVGKALLNWHQLLPGNGVT